MSGQYLCSSGPECWHIVLSNLTLDVIEDCNPHCVQANYLLAVWIVKGGGIGGGRGGHGRPTFHLEHGPRPMTTP